MKLLCLTQKKTFHQQCSKMFYVDKQRKHTTRLLEQICQLLIKFMFPLFYIFSSCYQNRFEYLSMKSLFLYSVVFAVVIFRSHGLDCTVDAPCVRFCCENCTDFDIAEVKGADKLNVNVKALKGKPCTEMYVLEPFLSVDDEWELIEVSILPTSKPCHDNSQLTLDLERRHLVNRNNSQHRPVLSSEKP